MKHILQGVTYDTDNATAVAERGSDEEIRRSETRLYRDPAGQFFAVHAHTWSQNGSSRTNHEWELIGNAAQALQYCERRGLTIYRNIEGMPRENESLSLSQRVPPAEYSTNGRQSPRA